MKKKGDKSPVRQVSGEILRTIEVRSGYVRLVGALVTEVLTPSEAREFAEDLIEAARDAEGRA